MKNLRLIHLLFASIAMMLFSACHRDKINPNEIDLSDVNQTCIKFNPDSVYIEGPVWALKYKNQILLYFPNENEAKAALEVITRNQIDEQCKIGEGVLIHSDGSETYHDNTMYYYLSNGEAPSVASESDDYLWMDANDVRAKKVQGNWTMVQGNFISGQLMFSFGDNKKACEDAVKVMQKFQFDRECFVGRPYPSMNFFIKTKTIIKDSLQK